MPTTNLAHERFIQEMILHGDRVKAYQAAYPNCSEKAAVVNACRLMSNPQIAGRIREAVYSMQQEAQFELKDVFIDQIMSTAHQRHLLYLIATGAMQTRKNVVAGNKTISWLQGPTIRDTLVAIGLDYKLSNGWKREKKDIDDET